MTKEESKDIMIGIHEAEDLKTSELSIREKELRKFVHDHVNIFNTYWELYDFCRETTRPGADFNGVTTRLRETWLNLHTS